MQRKKKRLLVVDDEQDILEFLKIILEEDGYTVDTTDKDDYLEKLNDILPDLILLDMLLSGKDGREIVKYLKMHEKTKHIPIILFSAHPGAQGFAKQAGADDFVAKPFEIDLLLNKIAQYLK